MKPPQKTTTLDNLVEAHTRRALVLGRIDELPSSPRLAAEIDRILQDPDCSIVDIETRLAEDQALVAKLLRLVNSAYYAPREPVSSLARAIALAGRRTVRNLLYALTTSPMLSRALPAYGYTEEGLWRYSLATAVAAQTIAREVESVELTPDEYFVVGLVHDIAKLVLAEFVPIAHSPSGSGAAGRVSLEDERALTGFDHAELGRIIGEKWRFPPEFSSIIGSHHAPESATEHARGAALVRLADDVTKVLGIGLSPEIPRPRTVDEALARGIGLNARSLAAIMDSLPEKLAEAGSLFDAA